MLSPLLQGRGGDDETQLATATNTSLSSESMHCCAHAVPLRRQHRVLLGWNIQRMVRAGLPGLICCLARPNLPGGIPNSTRRASQLGRRSGAGSGWFAMDGDGDGGAGVSLLDEDPDAANTSRLLSTMSAMSTTGAETDFM